MNLKNRRPMIFVKMIVAFVCGCCSYQSAAAYQVDVFFVGANAFGGPSDLIQFDQSGPQLAELGLPESFGVRSIATNNSSIFVAESSGAINRYDLQGNFLGEFADVSGLAGPNTIGNSGPSGQKIETDRSGNLYATFSGFSGDPRTSFRLDQSGAISATFSHPGLRFPAGIDADANGNVFILQVFALSNSVFQFDASGNYVNDFALPSEFPVVSRPADIAINEITNELFISDEIERSIHIYDLSTWPPTLIDTLPAPRPAADVFIEQVSGRIFGTTLSFVETATGALSFRSEGFEVSRDGELVASYV